MGSRCAVFSPELLTIEEPDERSSAEPTCSEDEEDVSWMSGHLWSIVLQSEILFGLLGTKITWQVFRNMFNTKWQKCYERLKNSKRTPTFQT